MIDKDALREMAAAEFGPDFRRLTPKRARALLDRVQVQLAPPPSGAPLVLDEDAESYDEVMRGFFARVFDSDDEAAFVLLWLTAFELWVSARYGDEFDRSG